MNSRLTARLRWAPLRRLAQGVLLAGALCLPVHAADTDWPSFRGHNAAGVATGYETATDWSVNLRCEADAHVLAGCSKRINIYLIVLSTQYLTAV